VDSAFSNKARETRETSRKVEDLDREIRHPVAQTMLRRAYHALSSATVPPKCAPSRDSNQVRSTIPKAFSGASPKYAA
jgi:hypothetical protein